MKIIISCCWPPDRGQGISTLTKELAASFSNDGHVVYYISPKSKNSNWYRENNIIPLDTDTKIESKDQVDKLAKIVNSLNADAIINNDHPHIQSIFPLIKCKKIVICHAMAWATFSLVLHNKNFIDHVIAISNDMRIKLIENGINKNKISLIHNGIKDLNINTVQNKIDTDSIRCVFSGNWTNIKGADYFRDAINLNEDNIDWLRIDSFGNGKIWSPKIGKNKQWFFHHGHVSREKFISFLSKADCLLFPSRMEGCPMTVIEAMSLGVIPIVSDGIGAMNEIVTNQKTGFIIELSNWKKEMWDILYLLNNDRALMAKIKTQARTYYENNLQINIMREKVIHIMGEIKPSNIDAPEILKIVKWHRPSGEGTYLSQLITKLSYRYGILRYSSPIKLK